MAPAVFAMLLLAVAVFQLTRKLLDPAKFAFVLSAVAPSCDGCYSYMYKCIVPCRWCALVFARPVTALQVSCHSPQSSHASALFAASY